MERAQADRAQAPARPKRAKTKEAADARRAFQPVYVEPRNTSFEREATRAARHFGRGSTDVRPSPLPQGGRRGQLGPDLARKVVGEMGKGGRALPGTTKESMERHFHRKLDRVRLHEGAVADEVAGALDTRAFTVGRNVFISSGNFAPGDPRSDRMLAHEIMHTFQQGDIGGTGEYVIQRDEGDNAADRADGAEEEALDKWEGTGSDRGFKLDFSGATSLFSMPMLNLPKINRKIKGKSSLAGITTELISDNFDYTTRGEERDTAQRQVWNDYVKQDTSRIEVAIENLTANPSSENDTDPVYYLKVRATNQILIGTKSQLLDKDEILIPKWDKHGNTSFFDVDHYREHQLEGPDVIENIWLLQNSANRSAGSKIRNTVLAEVNDLFKRARDDNYFTGRNASRDTLRFSRTPRAQRLHFDRVHAGDDLGTDIDVWTVNDIRGAKHFRFGNRQLIQSLPLNELRDMGLVAGPNGPPTTVLWFLGKDSGFYRQVDIADLAAPKYRGSPIGSQKDDFIHNFRISSATLNEGFNPEGATPDQQIGAIVGQVRGGVGTYYDRDTGEKVQGDRIKIETDITLPLRYDPRFGYGAYIDRSGIRPALMEARADKAKVEGMSPLAITEAGLTDNWAIGVAATLTSTHPMFAGFEATLGLSASGIELDVAIPTDSLDFGFFRVTEASLSVAYADAGLIFSGAAAFELPSVGSGSMVAEGEALEGSFDFDFDFVDPASITVRYENESWSFEAELGIKEGIIAGLQSGTINVGINEEGGLIFAGNAEVLLPGQSEPVSISVTYSEEEGAVIEGEVTFDTSAWPALDNARVTVRAAYDPETEGWSIGGTGSADFALPGVTGTLTASYRDGGIVFTGEGDLALGNATGTFNFVVGNYPVTEDGQFDQSAEPLDEFDAWGGGSVSIQFGRYLTGTAGLAYTPDDEIVIFGGIALPPSIELFENREYNRDLLDFPRIEFPIFGVTIPVVGSVGVFGFIGGGLRGYATVGPATLDDTRVDVEYTLGDPNSAVIHGESHLNFGMEAGLALDVSGGLGLGAAIADLTGEVGITAALELDVDAGSDLDVDWTPLEGLSLDLELHASASPSFKVGVFGRVAASVALYGEVWSERWDRTLAEFGSGLAIGVTQPASWDEENGLSLDFSEAEFTYPDFDIARISSDIMDRIIG